MMGVLTNGAQAALALALLEKLPLDKRQTGALGGGSVARQLLQPRAAAQEEDGVREKRG